MSRGGDPGGVSATAEPIDERERDALLEPLKDFDVALAVSGGADSMALMHLVAGWRRAAGPQDAGARTIGPAASPSVLVVTVDHGLRPNSAEEAAFVAGQARALGLRHQTLVWHGSKPGTGVQEAARHARYRLIGATLATEAEARCGRGASPDDIGAQMRRLITAHHQEDQAETLLMRLARGSGVDGLGCMRPTTTIPLAATAERPYQLRLPLMRPLLAIPKARLVATLKAAGAAWIDDPSNERREFERVRIRQAFSGLAELGLTAPVIARSAARSARAAYALERLTRDDIARYVTTDGGLEAVISLDELLAGGPGSAPLGEERLVRLLRVVIAAFGGAARAAALEQIETVAAAIATRAHGAKAGWLPGMTLGGCRLAGTQAHTVVVIREQGREALAEVPLAPGCVVDWDGGRFRVAAAADAPAGTVVRGLGRTGWRRLKEMLPALSGWHGHAAAVETLPAVWRGTELVAVPFFADSERRRRLPAGTGVEWEHAFGASEQKFRAQFRGLDVALGR